MITVKRGQVYLVDFDPALGAEIKKIRPGVVIQNDISNQYSPTTIIAAISSRYGKELYPTEIFVEMPEGGLDKSSVVQLDQLKTIDKQRLHKKIGALQPETMARVDRAIEISLGLIEL